MKNLIQDYTSPVALIESNYSGQHPRQMPIHLFVDFENEEITVDSREYAISGTPMSEWHGLVWSLPAPYTVDATKLAAFVDSELLPVIQKLSKKFESVWDGSNFVASFGGLESDEVVSARRELERVIEDNCPIHDGGFWEIGEWLYDGAQQNITASTTDDELDAFCKEALAEAESQCVVLDGDADDVLDFLKEIRADKQEEE